MSRHYALNAIAENALGLVQDYYRNPLTTKDWTLSAEWMYEVQNGLDLTNRTLFASFYLANEILSRLKLTVEDYQLVLITALHLSDAHDDWDHPKLEDYLESTNEDYTLEEFELFIRDCTTGLLLYEKHYVATLLGRRLILLHLHLCLQKVLKSKFRILVN